MPELASRGEIIPRSKWWWLAVAMLLLLAAWLYLRGYNVSLPYILASYTGEAQYLLGAQHVIDSGTARPVSHEAYPPGVTAVGYLFLKHLKPVEAHHGTMLPALRLTSILAWMLAALLIALMAARITHPLAGILAAAIWIVNPWIVKRAHFFVPDGFLTMLALLSLWLALVSLKERRQSLNTAALYSIMLASVFKTQAIFIAPIVIFLPAFPPPPPPPPHPPPPPTSPPTAPFSFWYLLLTPILEVDQTNAAFPVAYAEFALPSAGLLWEHLSQTLTRFQPLTGWLGIMLCGALLLRYRQNVDASSLLVLLLAAGAFLFGISLFGQQESRQFFVLGAMLAVLYGSCLCGLLYLLKEAICRLRLGGAYVKMLPAAFLIALVAIGNYPNYQKSDGIAHNFSLHDRRNDLARYMDTSLPPGMYVTNDDNHRTFNRAWGGYTGVHDFRRYRENALLFDKPIQDWRALGVEYAIMPHAPMLKDPDIFYPEDTVLLKTFPVDPNFRDPGMAVLRLYPMQHKADGQLGSIHLVGYDLSASEVAAGEDIIFRQYWRADKPTRTVRHVGNYLLNDESEVVAQVDYVPLWDDRRDTTTWDDPDEILIGREFSLSLPSDLPPATYQLSFGLYDTSTRLLSPEGSDLMEITEITVVQPEV